MQIGQLKEYVGLGVVTGFRAQREAMGTGWVLVVSGSEGRSWTLETKLGKVKVFAKLDTLIGQVEEVAGVVQEVRF
jgi:hypothetical protein